MQRTWQAITVTIAVIALVGCTSEAIITETVPVSAPMVTEGYPALELSTEGYPGGFEAPREMSGVNAPVEAPVTLPGTASISGMLVPRSGDSAVSKMAYYLTPGQGTDQVYPPDYISDPDAIRGDISGVTDEYGRFELANIPPGKYFLFVWGPYGWREFETGADDQRPLMLALEADERLALDIVYLTWP